tara:strand:- start:89 stop:583 length:495 start_codon:yes stop_codon:yes gene_type:complete
MKILICGLPGSGKTWLAERLVKKIDNCAWYNADFVRRSSNDWDFTLQGRIRQANRMKAFADFEKSNGRWVICDFVAPTEDAREAFGAEYIIWLDTIKKGRVVSSKLDQLKNFDDLPFDVNSLSKSKEFEETNNWFEEPKKINKQITHFLNNSEIIALAKEILNV